MILIGSRYPIPIDVPAWKAGLLQLRVQAVLDRLRHLAEASGPIEGSLNRNLFPRDEFAVR